MTPAETLLARLDGVKETASGCWIAKCPAHEDRSPSLSIRETGDGTLLLHDFAGCEVVTILAAIGLELRDLFPEQLVHHAKPTSPSQRRRYGQALEALQVLAHEALIITLAAETLADGGTLESSDLDRVRLAAERVRQAHAIAGRPLPKRAKAGA